MPSEGVPLWGGAPEGSTPRRRKSSVAGIREEQLRRAAILQKAAKGVKLTTGNARYVVARLAAVVPGMRYQRGSLIYASLAPVEPEIYAASPDPIKLLPGNPVGRSIDWNPDVLSDMLTFVESRMAQSGDTNAQNSLLAYADKVLAERSVHLSLKTLSNKLAEARRNRAAR